jgi:hypothetical protein
MIHAEGVTKRYGKRILGCVPEFPALYPLLTARVDST